jgi:hypothetical protein
VHFALRGYLFIALAALLGIAGAWTDEPAFDGAWLWPAFLLLAGLSVEAWYLRGTQVAVRMKLEERLRLGRPSSGAFAFQVVAAPAAERGIPRRARQPGARSAAHRR